MFTIEIGAECENSTTKLKSSAMKYKHIDYCIGAEDESEFRLAEQKNKNKINEIKFKYNNIGSGYVCDGRCAVNDIAATDTNTGAASRAAPFQQQPFSFVYHCTTLL